MKLSTQAVGSLMMALQRGLMEQRDITQMLLNFELEDSDEGLVVLNPPVIPQRNTEVEEETNTPSL